MIIQRLLQNHPKINVSVKVHNANFDIPYVSQLTGLCLSKDDQLVEMNYMCTTQTKALSETLIELRHLKEALAAKEQVRTFFLNNYH